MMNMNNIEQIKLIQLGEYNVHCMATTSTKLTTNGVYTCSDDCTLSFVKISKIEKRIKEGIVTANGKYVKNNQTSNFLTVKMKDSVD